MQSTVGNRAVRNLIGAGSPLPEPVQAELEARFSTELHDVRIHDDAQAHASAESLSAKAYVVGEHIVFGAQRYAPETSSGRRLLGHEIAHVIQQRRGGPAPGADPGGTGEQAAEHAGAAFAGGQGPVAVSGGTSVGIARAPADEKPKKETLEDYLKRGGKVEEVEPQKKQPKGDVLGKIPTREDKAASRQRALESVGKSPEDPTPINPRAWKDQGREEYQGALRRLAFEKDPARIPEPVRADLERQLKNMEAVMKSGKYDETKHRLRLPEGYVLGHYEGEGVDPTTPAREGFDYGNARVITVEQNQAEEAARRAKLKLESPAPAPKASKEPASATPPVIRRKAPQQPSAQPKPTGTPSAFVESEAKSPRVSPKGAAGSDVPAMAPKQAVAGSKTLPPLYSETLGEAKVARARNTGAVLGLGLGLLSGYALDKYRTWMEETLASQPPVQINQQSLEDYLKNSASSMRVVDLMAKDIAGFSGTLRERAQHAITSANLALIALALASPEVRLETLDSLGEEVGSVADELRAVRDGVEAALELEKSAREAIKAASDLADILLEKKATPLNALVWDQLIKLGFSIPEIQRIHNNLRRYAAQLEGLLKDLRDLQAAAEEMHLKANTFASDINRLYWAEILQRAKAAQQGNR